MIAAGGNRRYWGMGIFLLALLGVVMFVAAPASNRLNSGSTWGYDPDGYGAWYAYMQSQGVSVQRWQRPIPALLEQTAEATTDSPVTLLQVVPPAVGLQQFLGEQPWLEDWLGQGNHLIVLAQRGPATAAPFTTRMDSAAGVVTIETRRRLVQNPAEWLLADDYGAVVWRSQTKTGRLVLASTPFLAANAYLNASGNFAFVADLVQQAGGTIWIDEYLHGYKDRDIVTEEVAGNWLSYLGKTPLLVAVVQGGIVLIIVLVAQNYRPGLKQTVQSLQMDNSEAYLKALAGVLHKANNRDFLVETLTQAERKALQQALGLGGGDVSISPDALKTAWQQTTGRNVAELNVLHVAPKSDSALRAWLRRLQALHITANQRNSSHE